MEDGGKITVKAGAPVYARASLGNIAESKWLASTDNRPVAVCLKAVIGEATVLASIGADTPVLSDAEVPAFMLTSSITAETRASFQIWLGDIFFGEKRYVTLTPAG